MHHSTHRIARSLNIARNTVGEYLARVRGAGLSWPFPEDWDEVRLEEMIREYIDEQEAEQIADDIRFPSFGRQP